MNKDFALFQKYFKEYQKQFGLTGYKVYFKYVPLDGCYADINVIQSDMIATVSLDSAHPPRDVRGHAKHEALHLLLNKIEDCAADRYTRAIQIYEAAEEVVRKLEGLIKEG